MEIDVTFRRILFTAALLGLALAGPAQAVALYKWVDEGGRVHYSQTPPEKSSAQSEKIQVKNRNPYQKEDTAEKDEAEKPSTTDEGAKLVDTRKKNCEIARQNMETFKNSERVQQPDGKIITLSDEMRASKIKESQALINAYCN